MGSPTKSKSSLYSVYVAKLGRAIGLNGGIKIHIWSDFEDFFRPDLVLLAKSNMNEEICLKVRDFNQKKLIIYFEGYENPEKVKLLTNYELYTSEDQTRENCNLKNGEYFWFDIMGCEIVENDEILGKVIDIDRIGNVEYFLIKANSAPKNFMIPYIEQYVNDIDINSKKIYCSGAKDIFLES